MVQIDMQFEEDCGFVNALEQAMIMGIPVDVKQTYERLNQIAARGVGMESHSFKKNALTISLEDVGIAKGAMVAAGIVALGVILKKIYDWIMGFFRGGSSGSGGSSGITTKQVKVMGVLNNAQQMETAIKEAMASYSQQFATGKKVEESVAKIFLISNLPYVLHNKVQAVKQYANMYRSAMLIFDDVDKWVERDYLVVNHDRRNKQMHESDEMKKLEEKLHFAMSTFKELDAYVPVAEAEMVNEVTKQSVAEMTNAVRTNFHELMHTSRLKKETIEELRDTIEQSMKVTKQMEGETDPSEVAYVKLLKLHASLLNEAIAASYKMGTVMLEVCDASIRLCDHAIANSKGQKLERTEQFKHLNVLMKRTIEDGK